MKTTLFLGFGVLFWVSGAPRRIQTLKKVHTWFFEWEMHFWEYPTYSNQTSESVSGLPQSSPRRTAAETSATVQLPEYNRRSGLGGARQQSGSSAPGVQSLSPPCRGSIWTSESQGQSSFPPILLNHGRDIPHYESLLVEVPETSDTVFIIHNIIRGAHSFWPWY